eukprot:Rhum_TRINITY_DN14531_c2_g1::Rhum_TRINITY_DN14531_c2_g1_i1::g.97709::m.97709
MFFFFVCCCFFVHTKGGGWGMEWDGVVQLRQPTSASFLLQFFFFFFFLLPNPQQERAWNKKKGIKKRRYVCCVGYQQQEKIKKKQVERKKNKEDKSQRSYCSEKDLGVGPGTERAARRNGHRRRRVASVVQLVGLHLLLELLVGLDAVGRRRVGHVVRLAHVSPLDGRLLVAEGDVREAADEQRHEEAQRHDDPRAGGRGALVVLRARRRRVVGRRRGPVVDAHVLRHRRRTERAQRVQNRVRLVVQVLSVRLGGGLGSVLVEGRHGACASVIVRLDVKVHNLVVGSEDRSAAGGVLLLERVAVRLGLLRLRTLHGAHGRETQGLLLVRLAHALALGRRTEVLDLHVVLRHAGSGGDRLVEVRERDAAAHLDREHRRAHADVLARRAGAQVAGRRAHRLATAVERRAHAVHRRGGALLQQVAAAHPRRTRRPLLRRGAAALPRGARPDRQRVDVARLVLADDDRRHRQTLLLRLAHRLALRHVRLAVDVPRVEAALRVHAKTRGAGGPGLGGAVVHVAGGGRGVDRRLVRGNLIPHTLQRRRRLVALVQPAGQRVRVRAVLVLLREARVGAAALLDLVGHARTLLLVARAALLRQLALLQAVLAAPVNRHAVLDRHPARRAPVGAAHRLCGTHGAGVGGDRGAGLAREAAGADVVREAASKRVVAPLAHVALDAAVVDRVVVPLSARVVRVREVLTGHAARPGAVLAVVVRLAVLPVRLRHLRAEALASRRLAVRPLRQVAQVARRGRRAALRSRHPPPLALLTRVGRAQPAVARKLPLRDRLLRRRGHRHQVALHTEAGALRAGGLRLVPADGAARRAREVLVQVARHGRRGHAAAVGVGELTVLDALAGGGEEVDHRKRLRPLPHRLVLLRRQEQHARRHLEAGLDALGAAAAAAQRVVALQVALLDVHGDAVGDGVAGGGRAAGVLAVQRVAVDVGEHLLLLVNQEDAGVRGGNRHRVELVRVHLGHRHHTLRRHVADVLAPLRLRVAHAVQNLFGDLVDLEVEVVVVEGARQDRLQRLLCLPVDLAVAAVPAHYHAEDDDVLPVKRRQGRLRRRVLRVEDLAVADDDHGTRTVHLLEQARGQAQALRHHRAVVQEVLAVPADVGAQLLAVAREAAARAAVRARHHRVGDLALVVLAARDPTRLHGARRELHESDTHAGAAARLCAAGSLHRQGKVRGPVAQHLHHGVEAVRVRREALAHGAGAVEHEHNVKRLARHAARAVQLAAALRLRVERVLRPVARASVHLRLHARVRSSAPGPAGRCVRLLLAAAVEAVARLAALLLRLPHVRAQSPVAGVHVLHALPGRPPGARAPALVRLRVLGRAPLRVSLAGPAALLHGPPHAVAPVARVGVVHALARRPPLAGAETLRRLHDALARALVALVVRRRGVAVVAEGAVRLQRRGALARARVARSDLVAVALGRARRRARHRRQALGLRHPVLEVALRVVRRVRRTRHHLAGQPHHELRAAAAPHVQVALAREAVAAGRVAAGAGDRLEHEDAAALADALARQARVAEGGVVAVRARAPVGLVLLEANLAVESAHRVAEAVFLARVGGLRARDALADARADAAEAAALLVHAHVAHRELVAVVARRVHLRLHHDALARGRSADVGDVALRLLLARHALAGVHAHAVLARAAVLRALLARILRGRDALARLGLALLRLAEGAVAHDACALVDADAHAVLARVVLRLRVVVVARLAVRQLLVLAHARVGRHVARTRSVALALFGAGDVLAHVGDAHAPCGGGALVPLGLSVAVVAGRVLRHRRVLALAGQAVAHAAGMARLCLAHDAAATRGARAEAAGAGVVLRLRVAVVAHRAVLVRRDAQTGLLVARALVEAGRQRLAAHVLAQVGADADARRTLVVDRVSVAVVAHEPVSSVLDDAVDLVLAHRHLAHVRGLARRGTAQRLREARAVSLALAHRARARVSVVAHRVGRVRHDRVRALAGVLVADTGDVAGVDGLAHNVGALVRAHADAVGVARVADGVVLVVVARRAHGGRRVLALVRRRVARARKAASRRRLARHLLARLALDHRHVRGRRGTLPCLHTGARRRVAGDGEAGVLGRARHVLAQVLADADAGVVALLVHGVRRLVVARSPDGQVDELAHARGRVARALELLARLLRRAHLARTLVGAHARAADALVVGGGRVAVRAAAAVREGRTVGAHAREVVARGRELAGRLGDGAGRVAALDVLALVLAHADALHALVVEGLGVAVVAVEVRDALLRVDHLDGVAALQRRVVADTCDVALRQRLAHDHVLLARADVDAVALEALTRLAADLADGRIRLRVQPALAGVGVADRRVALVRGRAARRRVGALVVLVALLADLRGELVVEVALLVEHTLHDARELRRRVVAEGTLAAGAANLVEALPDGVREGRCAHLQGGGVCLVGVVLGTRTDVVVKRGGQVHGRVAVPASVEHDGALLDDAVEGPVTLDDLVVVERLRLQRRVPCERLRAVLSTQVVHVLQHRVPLGRVQLQAHGRARGRGGGERDRRNAQDLRHCSL